MNNDYFNHEKSAAGCVFLSATTDRVLLNLRASYKSHNLTWGFWGGMLENSETPKECLLRELTEEMGYVPQIDKMYPFDIYHSSDNKFVYYSFVCVVRDEFIPILNQESGGYGWFNLTSLPVPLHSGTKKTLTGKKSLTKLNLILDQHR